MVSGTLVRNVPKNSHSLDLAPTTTAFHSVGLKRWSRIIGPGRFLFFPGQMSALARQICNT
jgi:hypothetical protein